MMRRSSKTKVGVKAFKEAIKKGSNDAQLFSAVKNALAQINEVEEIFESLDALEKDKLSFKRKLNIMQLVYKRIQELSRTIDHYDHPEKMLQVKWLPILGKIYKDIVDYNEIKPISEAPIADALFYQKASDALRAINLSNKIDGALYALSIMQDMIAERLQPSGDHNIILIAIKQDVEALKQMLEVITGLRKPSRISLSESKEAYDNNPLGRVSTDDLRDFEVNSAFKMQIQNKIFTSEMRNEEKKIENLLRKSGGKGVTGPEIIVFDTSYFKQIQSEYDDYVKKLSDVMREMHKPTPVAAKPKQAAPLAPVSTDDKVDAALDAALRDAAGSESTASSSSPASISASQGSDSTTSRSGSPERAEVPEITVQPIFDAVPSPQPSSKPVLTPKSNKPVPPPPIPPRPSSRAHSGTMSQLPSAELFVHPSVHQARDLRGVAFFFDVDGTATDTEGQATFKNPLFKTQGNGTEKGIINYLIDGNKKDAEALYRREEYKASRVTQDMVKLTKDIIQRGGDVNFITNNAGPYVEFIMGLEGLNKEEIKIKAARAGLDLKATSDKEVLVTEILNPKPAFPEKFVVVDDDIITLWKMVKSILIKLGQYDEVWKALGEVDKDILQHGSFDRPSREQTLVALRNILKEKGINNIVLYQPKVGEKWQPEVMKMVDEMMKPKPPEGMALSESQA